MSDVPATEPVRQGAIVERAERTPAAAFGDFLMEALRNPEITADKMAAVMAMRREVLADQAREAFQLAFAEFQAELPEVDRDGTIELITKDGQNKGRLPFTTYEQMYRVLRPLLRKYGFSIGFSSRDEKDQIVMTGTLAGHGWERQSSYAMPPDAGPGRNALQARGSTRTYCKRYITDDLCNIVRKGLDNDGRGVQDQLIDATQVRELSQLLKATRTNPANFLKIMVNNAEALADVRVRDFTRLKLALMQKQDSQKKGAK